MIVLILLAGSLAGQAPAPAAKPAVPENENAKKARALLDKAIQALGGQAYLTSENRAEEGRWYALYHGQSRGEGIQYRQFVKYPDQDRLELIGRSGVPIPIPMFGSIDVIVVSKKASKSDLIVIHNGDKGYEITNKGTAAQDKDDLKAYLRRRQHSLQQVLRKWINDPTMQYFYDGLAIVDSNPTDQVTLLNNQNDAVSLYLDQNTQLPVKISYNWRDPEDKQRNVEEEIYANYRLEQGIMTPHSITRTFNGETSHQRFINTVRYNLTLPESTFQATVDYDPMAPPKPR